MILHFIQRNSTAYSNSINLNPPSIWITFKFQSTHCGIHFRKSWLQIDKEISHCGIVLATFQESFFFQIVDKN